MAKKVIEVDVQTNIPGTINELKQLKKELRNAAAGSEDFKRLYNEIDDLEEKIKGTKKASSDWVDSLASAPGPLGMVGRAINGVKEGTVSFGAALKATGIGLIVSLLGGLVAAFSQNESAMKKLQPLFNGLQKILGGIFRAMEPLLDTFIEMATEALPYITQGIGLFYSALVGLFTYVKEAGGGYIKMLKGIVTLDFDMAKEGFNQMKDSFSKAVKSGEDAYKRFESGSKEQTKMEKEEAEERKKIAEKAAEDKKKAQDKADADRKAANDKKQAELEKEREDAKAHSQEMAGIEQGLRNDLENIDAKSEQQKLDLQAQRELNTILAKKRQGDDITEIMKLYNEKYTKLDAELQEKLKKQADDKAAVDKANTEKYNNENKQLLEQYYTGIKDYKDAENDAEIEQVRAHQQALLDEQEAAAIKKTESEGRSKEIIQQIRDFYDQKEIANTQAASDAKIKIMKTEAEGKMALMKKVSEALGVFADLAGKQTAAGKALAVAQATINAYVGISEVWKAKNVYPEPWGTAIKVASTVTMAASAFKTVKEIMAVQVPGGGGGGSAPSGGGAGGSAPAPPEFNVVGNGGANQLAQTITETNKNAAPVQAYVVSGEVSTAQSLDRNRVTNASMG